MRVRWVFSNSCSEAYCKVICKELFLLLRASITSVCPPPSPQLRHCPSNIFYVGLNKTVQQIWQSLVQSCCTYIYLLKNYLPNKNLVWDFEEKIKNMIFWAIIDHNRRHLSKFREKMNLGIVTVPLVLVRLDLDEKSSSWDWTEIGMKLVTFIISMCWVHKRSYHVQYEGIVK